jgi:hypothetical protein
VLSAITLVRWVDENAFVIFSGRLDLTPPLADRFILGSPIDYGPVLLLMPFGFHPAVVKKNRLEMDTLPSGVPQAVASGPFWLYPAFAFVPV